MIEKTGFGDPVGGSTTGDSCANVCWASKPNCTWYECFMHLNISTNDVDYSRFVNAFYSGVVW